jgi:CheY-like chemotaxis protein
MAERDHEVTILCADDDEDDRLLTREALREGRLRNEVVFVGDGVELLRYLRGEGEFAGRERPGLVLLDLNMPRMDGREALREIKTDPALRAIPVCVLTTSKAEEDVVRAYDLGVNSFISKPVTFAGLVEAMRVFTEYWLSLVDLPPAG